MTFSSETQPHENEMHEEGRVELKLHRGKILMELVQYFKDPQVLAQDISVRMMDERGRIELGIGEGVLRDAFSEFWTDFFETCTLGHSVKIPFLRHDFGIDEWMSVGRVIVAGWTSVGYFPVQLALPLMEEALYGHSTSSIIDSFLDFISPDEKHVLRSAMTEFNSASTDDLLDVLDNHACHRLATAENLTALIKEIAHKEISQVINIRCTCSIK
jgi:hypothetical protein